MISKFIQKSIKPIGTKSSEMVSQTFYGTLMVIPATHLIDDIRRFTRIIGNVIRFIKKPQTYPADHLKLGCPYHPGITVFADGSIPWSLWHSI
jgi:hypothetical protein